MDAGPDDRENSRQSSPLAEGLQVRLRLAEGQTTGRATAAPKEANGFGCQCIDLMLCERARRQRRVERAVPVQDRDSAVELVCEGRERSGEPVLTKGGQGDGSLSGERPVVPGTRLRRDRIRSPADDRDERGDIRNFEERQSVLGTGCGQFNGGSRSYDFGSETEADDPSADEAGDVFVEVDASRVRAELGSGRQKELPGLQERRGIREVRAVHPADERLVVR